MAKKPLNIGLVGYGFMGRTHSNAFLQAPRYFDLPYQPVLKAVAAKTIGQNKTLHPGDLSENRMMIRRDLVKARPAPGNAGLLKSRNAIDRVL